MLFGTLAVIASAALVAAIVFTVPIESLAFPTACCVGIVALAGVYVLR